jgi:hypothetical protein
MDPGHKLLQHIKTVPNLVSEEPSTITPKNTSFVDVPWSDFSRMIQQKRMDNATKYSGSATPVADSEDYSPVKPEKGDVEDFTIGNWDATTGYQDVEHRKS